MGLLIPDGYTLDGVFAGVGKQPGCHYRYRPALADEVVEYHQEDAQGVGKKRWQVQADFLLKHLVSWDVTDEKGELAPITRENLRRLPYPLLAHMLNRVLFYAQDEEATDAKN